MRKPTSSRNSWVLHLSARRNFFPRSGRSRTDGTAEGAPEGKIVSDAKSNSILASFARKEAVAVHEPGAGYVMPTVIMLMAIMSLVAYAALLQSNNSLNLAYKQTYIQMARTASKAAIDYAQEQFDNSTCGNYNGTNEQDLASNNRYRATFKTEVVSTSADGLEKVVKGTGNVYLPKLSASAQYVFDIRSEIVRTYAACKTPDNFAPKVWLDASDTSTLHALGTNTISFTPTTSYGNAADSTRDTLEERVDNGTQTTASWQSDDFEMHICDYQADSHDGVEFPSSVCTSTSSRYLYNGMVFSNVNVPQGSTITSASIKLACTTPAGTGGSVTHRVYGIYDTATNPHPSLFTSSGSNQLRTKVTTGSLHTAAFESYSTNNCSPGNETVVDVTDIAQEIVNNANWNPGGAGNGGRMGFSFHRTAGSGSRHLLKAGNLFSISYSTTVVSPAVDTGGVGQWDDISGNANHAVIAYGNTPTREDNEINGKTVVRFNNGTMLSALTSAISNQREITVFAVVKPSSTTPASDGRITSGMSSAATNDTSGSSGIIPLFRNGTGDGFSSQYTGSSNTYRTNYTCGATCSNTPYLFVSHFMIDPVTNTITSTLKGNGATVASKTALNPSGSPYTFSIDQFYYGGRRTGSMAGGSGTDYYKGDFGEIVIYDKALECRQIEALEEYFRAKWAISASQYSTACPADVVPTL